MILLSKGLLSVALASLLVAGPALATEGIAPAGPIGGTDLNQALLPPPGIYPGLVGGGINLRDYHLGGGADLPASGNVGFGALGALVVYPKMVLGGQVGSSIGVGYQRVCFGVEPAPESCSEGAMDTYTDLFLWSRFSPSEAFSTQPKTGIPIPYGTAFMAGVGVTWPTGEYSATSPVNVGSNFYTISPSVAITYTAPSFFTAAPGHATQLSARLFYNYYTENSDTNYDTGDTVSIDFSASEIAGPWQFGVTGTGWVQISDDTVDGVSNGVRASALNVGPIAQYGFQLGGSPAFIKAKYLWMVGGEYIPQSDGLTVSMGISF